MKLRMMSGLLGVACISVACSGETGDLSEVSTLEEELTLLAKPGTDVAGFTEAGQDIERLGAYTFYSANADSHSFGSYEGSVQLFKNGAPFRSYQARNIFPGSRMGFFVGMSENWLATNVKGFPSAPGVFNDAVMIVGKNGSGEFNSCGDIGPGGQLPNCISCTVGPNDGSPDFMRLTCSPLPAVQMIRPAAFTNGETVGDLELVGNELLVPSSQKIALLKHDGTSWTESSPLIAPAGESFNGPLSLSGNRLAVAASGPNSTRHVNVYQRANGSAAWQFALRVQSPNVNSNSFGQRVDLSGNSLIATDSSNVYFLDLVAGTPANPEEGVSRSCSLAASNFNVAISGSNVVVATTGSMAKTFTRGTEWGFHGGLPSGIFPRDLNPDGSPTTATMWGAAVTADNAAIGWRNYRGVNQSTVTGAALEFSFKEYDCGYLRSAPGGAQLRSDDLKIKSVSAPQYSFYQFPVQNAADGDSNTRWMAPNTPGTKLDIDLGELRMFSHLEIEWGTTYSNNYTVQITENGTTWIDITQVTNGLGGNETVNLSNNAQAFGKAIRLKMNGFKTQPGTGDWGVAIKEIKAFRRVHADCNTSPTFSCTGAAPSHVCSNSCGGAPSGLSCYCDSACVDYGDCCSFDGANKGSEYASGAADVCDFTY